MTEADLKQHIVGLIREMIEDGATWVDERWGALGDMFEDLGGPECRGAVHSHEHANPDDTVHSDYYLVVECGFIKQLFSEGWDYALGPY